MTRALILTPVLLLGGTERHTQLLARVLCAAGHDVEVVCYYEHAPAMVTGVQAAGARVTLLNLRRREGLLRLLRVLKALIRKARPDVVHVEYVAPGFVPVLAARLAGARRLFATVHQPATPYGWKARLLLRTAARLCTAFFCVSQAVERSWFGDSEVWTAGRDVHSRRHWTLYTGVDVEAVSKRAAQECPALRAKLGLAERPVVGVVGRLRREKGQDILLDAMAEVVKEVPEARLLVVGDGPDREAFQAQARRLGLEGAVVWAGPAAPEAVHAYYGAMDVLAVPSRFEGFGLVAVEGLAAGLPVAASDVEGLREILEGMPGGKLVPAGDASALVKAIIELLQDPKARAKFGAQGKAEVARRFSMEAFAVAHRELCGEE
ncbi:MAG: glycosyltransferase family 4 protein [Acidobacteriota bacterium]